MINKGEMIGGAVGTILSATGTAMQPSEVLQIISLIITIIGGTISMIVIPLVSWYKRAKSDGKIDKEEVKEALDIVEKGSKTIKESLDDKKKGDK